MLNRGRAVILGGRAEMVTSPRIQAGLARPLREEGDDPDSWARPSSGTGETRALACGTGWQVGLRRGEGEGDAGCGREAGRGACARGEVQGCCAGRGEPGPVAGDFWAGRVCAGGVSPGERVRGSRPGWAACWGGKENWARKEGLGWVWVSGFLGWFGFSVFSFSFLFLNKTNLIEFKPNLNSKPYALNQTNKTYAPA